MNKLKGFIIGLLLMSLMAMIGIHWIQIQESSRKITKIKNLTERQTIASGLILELEKYRRLSSSFRKIGDAEAAGAKKTLQNEFNQRLTEIDKLASTDEERTVTARAGNQPSELRLLSARIEPTLYTRDFYQRPEGRLLHEGIVTALNEVIEHAKRGEKQLLAGNVKFTGKSTHWLSALAGVAVLLVCFLLLGHHFAAIRPGRALKNLAERYRKQMNQLNGIAAPDKAAKPLVGLYGEVEAVLRELAMTVYHQRLERHRFVAAIATELRGPLIGLKTGFDLFEAEQKCGARAGDLTIDPAREAIRRESFKLSHLLDDLTDLIEAEQTHLKLSEKIVDFQAFVQNLTQYLGGHGSKHRLTVSGPHVPIWTYVDSQRFERVLIHIISKIMNHSPQGGEIKISLNLAAHSPKGLVDGNFRGLEVTIKEVHSTSSGVHATGPEQDVLRHWVSDTGYGMALAQRIMQAHGGTLTVAGVAGTSVLFVLRIPSERIVSGAPRVVRPMTARLNIEGAVLGVSP